VTFGLLTGLPESRLNAAIAPNGKMKKRMNSSAAGAIAQAMGEI
jgi:hypothetical protein